MTLSGAKGAIAVVAPFAALRVTRPDLLLPLRRHAGGEER
jgi:hypothetical protein